MRFHPHIDPSVYYILHFDTLDAGGEYNDLSYSQSYILSDGCYMTLVYTIRNSILILTMVPNYL